MTELSQQKIANKLQMLETDVQYLRALVAALLKDASPDALETARANIGIVEKREPSITTDHPHKEFASASSSEIAAGWISLLPK
ncbi:hypothetical protein KTQ54_06115 [Komagataeibacter oboediens]|uniref:hypothetical protein n=1 Tax=Komagataeibacter oboediens TaxID=65958 RepID=UPI001C2C02A8|nr:hypothetical protein [Komagataeibacter oboediens]MBV0888113.1 hypothetical protein [Komagataeibacter oboediens]MCK9820787.1 hypothetical protein [Komagataeibacter oboediens]